jgi:hypothetical protein
MPKAIAGLVLTTCFKSTESIASIHCGMVRTPFAAHRGLGSGIELGPKVSMAEAQRR